ncbi:hypothetical protein [Salibaculum griseiflavum]|nr:hypothetical protein [Salibaculum griseiflavum]
MSDVSVKSQHIYNDLYHLMAEHFPAARTPNNAFDVVGFAKAIERAHVTIYNAFRADWVSVAVAEDIIRHSRKVEGATPLVWADLLPYVLPNYAKFSELPHASREASDQSQS